MGKILVFVVVAIVGWFIFKGVFSKPAKRESRGNGGSPEQMVQCDLCGVHMPESDSLQSEGKRTCRAPDHCAHRDGA